MLVYILLALLGIQFINRINECSINGKDILVYLIPYWKTGDNEDRILGILQLFIISCMSLIKAMKTEGMIEKGIIFVLTFISLIWLIKILLTLLEWFEEYVHTMTINIVFTLAVPTIILLNLSQLEGWIERQACFIALLMSVLIVYMELIGIVLGKYKTATKYLIQNSALKLKSILTWFFIILVNLYTLLLFIQFYIEPKAHHFIDNEVLTKSSAVDLFYYLIVTFTTVGFGDISPHTMIAKIASAVVALSGMLFTGIFVGCILNLKE